MVIFLLVFHQIFPPLVEVSMDKHSLSTLIPRYSGRSVPEHLGREAKNKEKQSEAGWWFIFVDQ